MKPPRFPLIAVLLACLGNTLRLCGAEAPAPEPKNLASVLQPFVDSHTLAGAVVLVASKDMVLDLEAVGYADVAAQRPMQTDCLFWIASQSKPITATALMMLVDEGKVNVEDPVEKYLPEFKGQMVLDEHDKDHKQPHPPKHPITVKNVLSHTSGLPFKSSLEEPTLDLFPLAQRVRSYAALPLQFEPDTKYQYSNAGINTAGRIIEVVSRMPYEQFLDTRLFRPLGMKDTTFWPGPAQLKRLAKSYKPGRNKKSLDETPIAQLKYPLGDRVRQPMPAGGLFSTAADLSLFYRMLAQGGAYCGKPYLSEKSLKQMTSKQTGELANPYGFGFNVGGGKIGHGGAYNTHSTYDPERQLITIFLVQHAAWGSDDGKKIHPAFQQAAEKLFAAQPATLSAAAKPVEAAGQPPSVLPNLNKLTDAEKAAGWMLLFDGKTTAGWRNFRKQTVSSGWQVIDGALCRVDKSAGDLITAGQYANFVLELDFKVPSHANSGIMYRVSEDEARAPFTGVEYQILDNTDAKGDSQKAGWAYALYQPPLDPQTGKPVDATRPVGQWNHVKLLCNGPHVEHWMNGVKYCDYEIGSADWNQRVAKSKFAKWPKFAHYKVGHIALQGDHGDVSFTNIKLRPLP